MASLKREIIEISSGSDDDNPLVTRRKMRKLRTKPQPRQEVENEHDKPSFAEFIARALPTKLIPADLAAYLHRESNIRLQTAKENGVKLDDIFIGDDCLPTWAGIQWDPEVESLHCAIQNRLLDLQVSQELGDLLRNQIISKGNRKLDEARKLDIDLRNIEIGDSLLATWDTLVEAGDMDDFTAQSIEAQDHEGDMADDEMETPESETAIPHPQMRNHCDAPQPEDLSCASTITALPSPPYMSDDSCSSDSSSDSDVSDDDMEDFEDAIFLNNFVDRQPYYLDSDPHVIHDVQVLGGPLGFSDVDLEIYLADDDENLDELPEIELAIDREGFEYYFGVEGAVDVEIPDIEVRCSGAISEDDIDDTDIEETESIQERYRVHHSPFEEEQRHQQDAGVETVLFASSNSAAAHEPVANACENFPYEDEAPGVNIEETEYGFKW